MISYLEGKIIDKDAKGVILLVVGVGYKVFLGENFLKDVNINSEMSFFIHYQQREDATSLYGFTTKLQLDFFHQLIGISGVGPKLTMNLLDSLGVNEVKSAIANKRVDILTKTPGLGKKIAERLITEMKDKIFVFVDEDGKNNYNSDDEDVINALIGLGYKLSDATQIVKALPDDIKGVDDRIKEALKHIGKSK